jgi:hypothetical protein
MVPYVNNEPDLNKLVSLEGFLSHHLNMSNQYKPKEFYKENAEEHIDDGVEVPILGNLR